MNFFPHDMLAGYARTAVDLRSRMVDYHRSPLSHDWLDAFMNARAADTGKPPAPGVLDAIRRVSATPWETGEPYVVAPAMTAPPPNTPSPLTVGSPSNPPSRSSRTSPPDECP